MTSPNSTYQPRPERHDLAVNEPKFEEVFIAKYASFKYSHRPDLRADYVLANPRFNDSDALRTSGCPHRVATMPAVIETKDNFHQDDDHA